MAVGEVSSAKAIRAKLESEGKMKPEPVAIPVHKQGVTRFCGKLAGIKAALFIFEHGIGDAVVFTSVLAHLRQLFPDMEVDIQADEAQASVFRGQVRRVFTLRDPIDMADYQMIDRPMCHGDIFQRDQPCNKAAVYLRESMQVPLSLGCLKYWMTESPEAAEDAALFLRDDERVWGRSKAIVLHYEGRTLKTGKDLTQSDVAAIGCMASELGYKTYVLDFAGTCQFKGEGMYVIRPDSDLWGGGPPTPQHVLALANRVSLCIGIDSGPGHIFGASKTATIIGWTKHHPAQYYGVCANVHHVVPRGMIGEGDTFFRSWYRFSEYGDNPGEQIAREASHHLQLDRSKRIRVQVPQGLGDIFWVLQKLSPHYDTIDLDVGMVHAGFLEDRSLDWCNIFPKVGDVRRCPLNCKEYTSLIGSETPLADVRAAWERGAVNPVYSINRPLEKGTAIEEVDRLGVDFELEVTRKTAKIPYDSFITVAISAGTLGLPYVWTVDQWDEFITLIYDRYSLSLPIVMLGAEFDRVAVESLAKLLEDRGHAIHVMVARPPAEVADAIARSELHLGYQSGLNIIADRFDRQQVMMYFPSLPDMEDSWAKPENRGTRIQTFLFSKSPKQVAEAVKLPISPKRRGLCMLATWGIGDFIASYTYMSPLERNSLTTLYWATRNRAAIEPLARIAFPRLTHNIDALNEFGPPDSADFCITDLTDLQKKLAARKKRPFDVEQTDGMIEGDINSIGRQMARGERSYHGPGVFAKQLADVSWVGLPNEYWVIHPYSENARKTFRDLNRAEFDAAVSYLRRHGRHAVIVGRGEFKLPEPIEGVTDLTNHLSIVQAMEVVRRCNGFIGGASCFSVIASKHLHAAELFVKTHHIMRGDYWRVYYAPQQDQSFLHSNLDFLGSFTDRDPAYRSHSFITHGDPFGSEDRLLEVCEGWGVAFQSSLALDERDDDKVWKMHEAREGTITGRKLNRARADLAENVLDGRGAVLDFGIGCGSFINATTARCYGYDESQRAMIWLRDRQLYADYFSRPIPTDVRLFTFWDSLDSFRWPSKALTRIPSGCKAIVAIPVQKKLKGVTKSRHYKPRERLWYWTDEGFKKFVETLGFRLIGESGHEGIAGRSDVTAYILERA